MNRVYRRGGGVCMCVCLYVCQFVRVQCLAGHEDWVRDVQFCQESKELSFTSYSSVSDDLFVYVYMFGA